jgi:hypothetical protein
MHIETGWSEVGRIQREGAKETQTMQRVECPGGTAKSSSSGWIKEREYGAKWRSKRISPSRLGKQCSAVVHEGRAKIMKYGKAKAASAGGCENKNKVHGTRRET